MVSDYVKSNNKRNYIFVVHRLDQDTSGVLMFCKNEKILSEMLKGDSLKRFNKLVDASDELSACTGTENFKMGFILGVQLMADCFKYDATTIFKDI